MQEDTNKNEFIWACDNIVETCRKVTRPNCRITGNVCICTPSNKSFDFELLREYRLCPGFKENPKWHVSNEERIEIGLLYFVP